MRFRLGINANGSQQLSDGVGNGMRSLFALPMLRAQAAEEAQLAEGKQRLVDAQVAEHQAKADAERTQLERGGLGELLKSAALQNGVPLHQLPEATDYLRTGRLAGQYEVAPGLQGPVLPKPQYADPDVGRKIYQTLGLTQQALTVGDKSVENIAKATGAYQDQGITDAAVAAAARGDDMAMSRLNSVRGKKEFTPFAAVGNTGVALNQVTGQGNVADAGLRALFGDVQGANILRDKAGAAASYASAEHSRAGTDKIRQEIEQGGRTGALQVVTGPNGEVTIVDKVNRTAQPVLGADGRPVVKGAAGGGGKPMTEGQAKANLFGGRMMESGKILDDLDGKYSPSAVGTKIALGKVPLIGGMLEAGGNAALSDSGQRAEQATRDFINAVLRRESGAAISASEFDNAMKQYFPEPNDTPGKKEQKRRNRQIATTLMLQEVPEAQRYRLGTGYSAPAAPVPQQGGATGDFGAPAAPAGWSIQKVN